jgi:hypothetical protein
VNEDEVCIDLPCQRKPIGYGLLRRFRKIGGYQDLLERNHASPLFPIIIAPGARPSPGIVIIVPRPTALPNAAEGHDPRASDFIIGLPP